MAGSSFGTTTTVAPAASGTASVTTAPSTWKNGARASTVSRGPTRVTARIWRTAVTRLAWLSSTPLGRPVVPAEYGTRATAAGSAAAGPSDVDSSVDSGVAPGAAPSTTTCRTPGSPRAASTSRGVVTTTVAPASASCAAASRSVHFGFSAVTAAPARIAASAQAAQGGVFGDQRATVSPGRTPPGPASQPLIRATRRRSSA